MPTVTPDWLLDTIRTILNEKTKPPSSVPLWFEQSAQAAEHNMQVLQQYGNNIDACVQGYPRSIISYRSEYWDPTSLQSLLMHHPWWPNLLLILTSESKWLVAAACDDNTQQAKNNEFIEWGNHKSAIQLSHIWPNLLQLLQKRYHKASSYWSLYYSNQQYSKCWSCTSWDCKIMASHNRWHTYCKVQTDTWSVIQCICGTLSEWQSQW